MPRSYTWAQSFSIGNIAEEAAIQYFTQHGYKVDDVRSSKFFRKLDVDFNILGFGLVEVKGDTYPMNNMFVEVLSNVEAGKNGCLMYTQAEYLFYYYLTIGKALLLPVPEFQEWASRRVTDFPQKTSYTHQHEAGFSYHCIGHAVPVSVILDEVEGAQLVQGLPIYEHLKRKKGG